MMVGINAEIFNTEYIKENFQVSIMDNEYFLKWYIGLREPNKSKTVNSCYSQIFIGNRGLGRTYRIMSFGMYMGFCVYASDCEVRVNIFRGNEIIKTYEMEYDIHKTEPYEEVFAACVRTQKMMKEMLPDYLHDVPFVGDCKNVKFEKRKKKVALFYIPEIAIYGYNKDLQLFSMTKEYDMEYRDVDIEETKETLVKVKHFPEKETYIEKLKHAISSFNKNGIEKMVVSQKCVVTTKDDINLWSLSKFLLENYYQQYFYIFELENETQWIGVSPEVLITDDSRHFISKPLAGTYGKGKNEKENHKIKMKLLQDNKEILEHSLVVNLMLKDINKRINGKAELVDSKEIVETPYVFHLKSQIRVAKKEVKNVFELLQSIYPPATIWGIPRKSCGTQIYQIENFERGYFTGCYGIFTLNDFAEFALVIRSACVDKNELSIFAGSGVIGLSDPEYEWNEINVKMSPFINYFKEQL